MPTASRTMRSRSQEFIKHNIEVSMIDNPKVIVIERPSGSLAVSVTNGSDNFHDGIIMVAVDNKDGDDLIDMLESVLFYAAKRIIQLEKGGYSPPSSSESGCESGVGKREKGQDY